MRVTEQEKFWSGPFGTEYTQRNRVDWHQRRSFWELMLEQTGAKSVLEVGCNAGWNLLALKSLDPLIQVVGVDVNRDALKEANLAGIDARELPAESVGRLWPGKFDLVFTAGVLIHVPPETLSDVMRAIIAASKHWVLAVEYPAATSEEIDYRGHSQRLWRRPFGGLYEDMGLVMVSHGDLGKGDGFDNCRFWLMRKRVA